jgi:translation initiation factor IF-3
VGEDGVQLGILPTEKALDLAMEQSLDLVEVAPNARPPVCRIMDYGKFKYDKKKKTKKKVHVAKVKEVRFRPKTDENDYAIKCKKMREFLAAGHRAVVTVIFKGREMAFRDQGRAILTRLVEDMADIAKPEAAPRMEGRRFTLVLLPTKVPPPKQKSEPGAPGEKKADSAPAKRRHAPGEAEATPAPAPPAAGEPPAPAPTPAPASGEPATVDASPAAEPPGPDTPAAGETPKQDAPPMPGA